MSVKEMDLTASDQESEFQGSVKKWTNYILGWKSRYFVSKGGHLLYYKSQDEMKYGCRGSINLSKATVVAHQMDECRFDIYVSDFIWYLRADSAEARQKWVVELTTYARSKLLSTKSSIFQSDFLLPLMNKLQDIKTYRDLLSKQLNQLQAMYEGCRWKEGLEERDGSTTDETDLKGEIVTFKATVSAFLNLVLECVEMIDQSKDLTAEKQPASSSVCPFGTVTPEMDEGQHCLLGGEEFFDAVEFGLERIEEEAAMRKRLEDVSREVLPISCNSLSEHPLQNEIAKMTEKQILMCCSDVNEGSWKLLMADENTKIYTREQEVGGLVVDPLRASCTVTGVTGREICHYFFNPQFRKDWETTLEQMEVVERIGQDTIVFHQVYKRIWPASQRDTLFWSHLSRKENPNVSAADIWAVVNNSVDLPQFPINGGKYVRVTFAVCMYCVTEIAASSSDAIKREDITTHITYCSVVNPGGWVPASAVRALQRKEYPKFLSKFTSYVVDQTKDKEMML